MDASAGFPPVAGGDARILVLGSLPGRRSLEAGEYYAHARNAFWPIMEALFDARGDYARRCNALVRSRVAVWDVLEQSVRPGSLDADIRMDTARPNDFGGFFERHTALRTIGFNGKKAEAMFRRLVLPSLSEHEYRFVSLPSTSPANAMLSFDEKLAAWKRGLLDY